MTKLILGGNKGHEWLESFMGLIQSISLARSAPVKEDSIMTSNRIKVITILSNLIVSNLLEIDYDVV